MNNYIVLFNSFDNKGKCYSATEIFPLSSWTANVFIWKNVVRKLLEVLALLYTLHVESGPLAFGSAGCSGDCDGSFVRAGWTFLVVRWSHLSRKFLCYLFILSFNLLKQFYYDRNTTWDVSSYPVFKCLVQYCKLEAQC